MDEGGWDGVDRTSHKPTCISSPLLYTHIIYTCMPPTIIVAHLHELLAGLGAVAPAPEGAGVCCVFNILFMYMCET